MMFKFSNHYQLSMYDLISGWYYIHINHDRGIYELHIRRDLERMIIGGCPPNDSCILIYNADARSFAYFIKNSRRIPVITFMIDGTEPLAIKYISECRSYSEYLALAR